MNQVLFTRNEWFTLGFRAAGVLVSALTSVFSLKVIMSRNPTEMSGLMTVMGLIAFVPLTQLGLGRPAYSELRSRLVQSSLVDALVLSFARLFGFLSIIATISFGILGQLIAQSNGLVNESENVMFFGVGLAAFAASTFQRDIAYGTSTEQAYETWETIRRCALLVAYSLLWVGSPMWVFAVFCCLTAFYSQWKMVRMWSINLESQSSVDTLKNWRQLQPKLQKNAAQYFVFSANELLLYNLPLLAFTFISDTAGIVYFSVWMRLFQLVILPMRMLVDARNNRLTEAYHENNYYKLRNELKLSLLGAISVCLISIIIFAFSKNYILQWIGVDQLLENSWIIASITVWAVANTMHHVLGTFTLSYGDGFKYALGVSFRTVITMIVVLVIALALGCPPSILIIVLGLIYSGWVILYIRHVKQILSAMYENKTT